MTTKRQRSPSLPKPIPHSDLRELLVWLDEKPSDFWDAVDGTWDWAALREGGRLNERMQRLDEHFVALGKTHKICPIVLLLKSGARE